MGEEQSATEQGRASLAEPDKAGFLGKRSDVVKQWRRRWFTLRGDTLSWGRTNQDAPHGKRGAYTSWIQTTATLGLFLSLMVILGTRTITGEEAFADWGWRVPFIVSIALLSDVKPSAAQGCVPAIVSSSVSNVVAESSDGPHQFSSTS